MATTTDLNDPIRRLPLNGQFINIGGTTYPQSGNQVPSLPTVSHGGAAPVATVAGQPITPR